MLMFSFWLVPSLVISGLLCAGSILPWEGAQLLFLSLCCRSVRAYPSCISPPILKQLAIPPLECGFEQLLPCSNICLKCLGSIRVMGNNSPDSRLHKGHCYAQVLWHLASLFSYPLHCPGKVQGSCFGSMPESSCCLSRASQCAAWA